MAGSILDRFQQGAQDLMNGVQAGGVIMSSTSLRALNSATLGNAGYFASIEPQALMMIDARSRFFEAGLISCASCVHNFVMFLIYGIAALIQGCQNVQMNTMAKRSMLDMSISVLCVGIGLVGIFSPEYGARGTANLANGILESRQQIADFLA